MKKTLQMVGILAILGALAGALLAGMYAWSQPEIERHEKAALRQAIFRVLPDTVNYEALQIPGEEIYRCFNKNKKVLGFAILASGNGYQDKIELMLGTTADLSTIKGIEVLKSKETPGLGARIAEEEFKNQFRNLPSEPEIKIQAITGATISSTSVVKIIEQKLQALRPILINE